jgi:hypothetical protein
MERNVDPQRQISPWIDRSQKIVSVRSLGGKKRNSEKLYLLPSV